MAPNWRWIVMVVLVSLTAPDVYAGESDMGTGRRILTVRTYNRFGVSAHDLVTAQAVAGHVFDDIGIRVVWMNCGTGSHRLEAVASHCSDAPAAAEVILRICAAGRGDVTESATMGFALVDADARRTAVLATVYADRVFEIARGAGVDPRPLLGLAIGHELGHLLLSTGGHAVIGLMRANWSQAELRRTKPLDWRFLDAEAHVIQAEVTRRTAHVSERE